MLSLSERSYFRSLVSETVVSAGATVDSVKLRDVPNILFFSQVNNLG